MEFYLTIITTILVLTQVVRITQNMISLHRQNKVIRTQLGQIEDIGDADVKRRMEVDALLIELLPKLIARYSSEEDEDE